MVNRYYKKSAAVHENILRVFTDPSYAEMEAGLGGTMDPDRRSDSGPAWFKDSPENDTLSRGQHARQHLHYLKLAVQRHGVWPNISGSTLICSKSTRMI